MIRADTFCTVSAIIFNSSAWLNDSSNTLSEIMYKQLTSKFPHSILINNELLNKHILSSSYKKARDIIVDRIIDSNFDNSDLSPSSAEMTVYNSVFDEKNICLRAGHHCAQLIIKWLGVVGTLRACIYVYNDFEDMDKFIEGVKEAARYFKEW